MKKLRYSTHSLSLFESMYSHNKFIHSLSEKNITKGIVFSLLFFSLFFGNVISVVAQTTPFKGLGSFGTSSKKDFDYANPKEYTIGGISVEGASYLDPNALISLTGLRIGDKIIVPGETIGLAIRKLWKQGLLGDVSIEVDKVEGEKIFLKLILTERPRLSRFDFTGIPKGQQNTLKDKVTLVRGRIVNDVIIKNTEVAIKQHYIQKGFNNIKVNIVQKKDTTLANSIRLEIDVDKGKKVRIEDIEIEGNEAIADKKLKRKMKKTKEFVAWNIFRSSKFIPKEFKNDKQSLIAYYNKQGYRDAYVISDTVKKEGDNVKIKLTVNEGNKYHYRNITWSGNYIHSDTLLSSVLGIRKGDVYNPEDLQKRMSYNPTGLDITSLYMDDGYLFFNIQPIEVRVENDSIDIEMRIFEGDQATISKVIVTGNTRTRDHVILREVYTVPGQKFSRSALLRTQQQLSQLGYFDAEQIGINPIPNMADGTVDIHYSVVEKPNDQIELSGGWGGGTIGFIGTLGLTFNNFSSSRLLDFSSWSPLPQGDGQQVSLRFQASGRQFQTYSFSFTEPWLGGKKPNSFSISLQHSKQSEFNFSREITGNFQVSGITLALGRRLRVPDNYFTLSNSLSFLRYSLNNYTRAGFRNIIDGSFNNIVFNTTLSRSSVDSPIYPRNGSTISLSLGLTPPYSSFRNIDYQTAEDVDIFKFVEYHKWMFDNTWYTPIAGDLVFSARAHMGFIGSYNKNAPTSPFERFILGGAGLGFGNLLLGSDIIGLRGYEDNSVVPSDSKREGGVAYNKFVMELRYPVTLNQAASIFVLAFAEGGNNWGSFQDFKPFDLKRSAGVGARIFMPAFGLLGIDWAYGFDQIPGNPAANGPQFHFTIGQMLR
ncbi:outer membrane protein assembly factor BamA [Bernardetia sp.]|uniref:outer membrane protein assembly factor BamA n=1 Tax=Bernardetia sp. TaxID=1937974 RepID=UPI0025C0BD24|nr:outer membrane protein assembly factor BamA [Bernardetia sp.]